MSELKTELSPRTGRPRLRCLDCNKVAFSTELLAHEASLGIEKDRDVKMYYYQGGCGHWHLTRMPQKKGRGK